MSQIFQPRANLLSKASLVAAPLFLIGLILALTVFFRSSYFNHTGVAIAQPVPFPHDLHVTGLGLDCRFCHSSVEKSDFAGYPSTDTCMTCHSQVKTKSPALVLIRDSWYFGRPVQWNRVYNLADFVYFKHQIHVAKGIACETCHGRVDQMGLITQSQPLTMNWCLNCHRHPEDYVRPKEDVFLMGWNPPADQTEQGRKLVQEYQIGPPNLLEDCSICHY